MIRESLSKVIAVKSSVKTLSLVVPEMKLKLFKYAGMQ